MTKVELQRSLVLPSVVEKQESEQLEDTSRRLLEEYHEEVAVGSALVLYRWQLGAVVLEEVLPLACRAGIEQQELVVMARYCPSSSSFSSSSPLIPSDRDLRLMRRGWWISLRR